MREIFLDARHLEHPEPLEKAIASLKQLDESSYFYMLHRREPIPLLALASEHNLNLLSELKDDGNWHIIISPNRSVNLDQYIYVRV